MSVIQRLRGARAAWRRRRYHDQPQGEVLFLVAGDGPEAGKAFEMLPGEARAWHAGVCAGRAEAYRAAAEQFEDVPIDSLDLWGEYERQVGDHTFG